MFIDPKLMKKVSALGAEDRTIIKTWARACTIPPEFVGRTIAVHNGRVHVPVLSLKTWLDTSLVNFHQLESSAFTVVEWLRPNRKGLNNGSYGFS